MRIALLCPGFLRVGGGSVLYARQLAAGLRQRGHDLRVVTDAVPGTPVAVEGAPVIGIPRDGALERQAQRRLSIEGRRGGYQLGRLLFRSGAVRLLASGPASPALERGLPLPCDVAVLVNASTAWSLHVLRLLKRRPMPPVVVVPLLHTQDAWASWPVVLDLLNRCSGVIGLTPHEGAFLRARRADRARFVAVPSGCDTVTASPDPDGFRTRHGIPPDAPIVLFLGRKIFGKGVVHVIEAMDSVWPAVPAARLVLMGFSHNGRAWMREQLAASVQGADARTVDLDDVSEQERESALAACSVMAAPSVNDSFGIVYLDAWRHGRPVVGCSDAPAAHFVRDGETGRLVPFGDVAALGSALLEMLRDPAGAARMGAAGRETWRRDFQWSELSARVEDFLGGTVRTR